MKKEVNVYDLQPGMIVSEDVVGKYGQLLIRKGVVLNDIYIHYLKRLGIKQVTVSKTEPQAAQTDMALPKMRSETASKPKFVVSFHRELISELPILSRKMLTPPTFGDTERRQIVAHMESVIAKPDVLSGLFKMRLVEENMFRKTLQVAMLATAMGMMLGLKKKQLDKLTIAALLYDLGNFWINRNLLAKPARFNEKEKQMVETHTVIGYTELANLFDEEIARVAYQHHERHDGSGYPNRESGDNIDLFAKIVSICDVYVSMITPRPFRPKYEPIEVLEYMMGAGGTLFDPEILKLFLQIIPAYSVGSLVELSNHCIGVVVDTDGKPLGRPVVEILFDENGKPVQNQQLDLTQLNNLTISIKRVL